MTIEKGDSRYTWFKKPGALSHAVDVGKQNRIMTTLCGLRVGIKHKSWIPANGKGHPCYKPKCPNCAALVRRADRVRAVGIVGYKMRQIIDPDAPEHVGRLQRTRDLILKFDLKEMLAEILRRGKKQTVGKMGVEGARAALADDGPVKP